MSARQTVLKQKYKQNANGIGDTDNYRTARKKELENHRKEGRVQAFNTRRLIPNVLQTNQNKLKRQSSFSSTKTHDETKSSSDNKPPFVVGIVRYPLNPTVSVTAIPIPKKTISSKIPVRIPVKQNKQITNPKIGPASKQTNIPNPPLKSRPVATVTSTNQRGAPIKIFKAPALPQAPASKKVSRVTEKRLAAKAAAVTRKPAFPVHPGFPKKIRESAGNKGKVNEKPKLNTTFEKEDTELPPKEEKKDDNVTKRKSRSVNKTQPNLNETFEKKSDDEIVPSKSIIASADMAAVTTMNSNLTVTTSFFIPNDRASTPNTSIETVTLRLSESEKSKDCSKRSSIRSRSRRSNKSFNGSTDGQQNANSTLKINTTFDIKGSPGTSRSLKSEELDNLENSNVEMGCPETGKLFIKKEVEEVPCFIQESVVVLERPRSDLISKTLDHSTASSASSNQSTASSTSKRKLLDTSIEENEQDLISEDEQPESKFKKRRYAKSKKTSSRDNSLITDDESERSAELKLEQKKIKMNDSTFEIRELRKSHDRRTFDKMPEQTEDNKNIKKEMKDYARKSKSLKSTENENVSFLNNSTDGVDSHEPLTKSPSPVVMTRKRSSQKSPAATPLDEAADPIEKNRISRRTRSLEKKNSLTGQVPLDQSFDGLSLETPFNKRQSNAERLLELDSEVSSQEHHETYDQLFGENEAIKRKSSTPMPSSGFLKRTNSVPDNSLRKSLLKSLSEDNSIVTPEAKRRSLHTEMPALFSPNITCSRGKNNARKEELRRSLNVVRNSPNEDDIPTKETVMQKLNISQEEEERTAQYFRFLANREIKRLTMMCDEWLDKIPEAEKVSEEAKYTINQAVGQTNLLLDKKMQRFLTLVKDCEDGQGQHLVTCKDLQGFWDMTYIEVENCVNRFDYLCNLERRNWIDTPEETLKPKTKPKPKAKLQTAKKTKAATKPRPGSLMEKIRALKAKNKDIQGNDEIRMQLFDKPVKQIVTPTKPIPDRERRTPTSLTRTRPSLSKESPLTMMKVSQFYKAPRVELDDSISYVNSTQTPAKSILKNAELNQSRKSIFKVNFNDTIVENTFEMSEDENKKSLAEISISKSLAVGLARIDNFRTSDQDDDDKVIEESLDISADKQLNFDTRIAKTVTESDENKENTKKSTKKSRSDDESEEEIVTRSLRNRLIKTPVRGPTEKSRTLKKDKKQDETPIIKTPPKSKNKRGRKSNIEEVTAPDSEDKIPSTTPKRKGTRRRTLNETQENVTEENSNQKVNPVKAEFIKLHPSQQKSLSKTPSKRLKKIDEIAADSPKRRATPR